MTSSREVFALRKEGKLADAYKSAQQLVEIDHEDEWNIKALAWCLIDLIKLAAKEGNQEKIKFFTDELNALSIDPNDEILAKQVEFVNALADKNKQLEIRAKELSRQGAHEEAADIYRKILRDSDCSIAIQTSLAWELYRILKKLLAHEHRNVNLIKTYFLEYLQLTVERPSRLHSLILQLAIKMADETSFDIARFARLWGLNNFQPEDFEESSSFNAEHFRKFPALAERVILKASKSAAKSLDTDTCRYLIPFLDEAIGCFPENIWLKLNKARVLVAIGEPDTALEPALELLRMKSQEFWAWELLGDIHLNTDEKVAQSCFCKALMCEADAKFTPKVRIKLARLLRDAALYSRAKHEIEEVIGLYEGEGWNIPPDCDEYRSEPWYAEAGTTDSNVEFYRENIELAEGLLLTGYSWIAGTVGDTFAKKKGTVRRKIFLKVEGETTPVEISIPENSFEFSRNSLGSGLQVKGEFDSNMRFQTLKIAERSDSVLWDIFDGKRVGVVSNVNREKKVIGFILSKDISGVVEFSNGSAAIVDGDAIEFYLSVFFNKRGETRYRGLCATKTQKEPSDALRCEFSGDVEKINEFGLAGSKPVFIPPPLMKKHQIRENEFIRGVAILNYNKRREEWGWKAVSIDKT